MSNKPSPMNHGNQTKEGRTNDEQPKNQKGTPKWGSTFKGETADMNGNVFQLQSEKDKKGQF